MQDRLRKTRLGWKPALVFLIAVIAAPSAFPAPSDAESRQAELKLREYFEFPHRPLEKSDFTDLAASGEFLKATSKWPAVAFASHPDMEGNSPGGCGGDPVILVSSGREWWITETRLYSYHWRDVWATPDRSRIWAVLEHTCEGPGGEALILYSSDAGWTWASLSTVSYCYYQDSYKTLRMAPDGQGTMVVSWDCADSATNCRVCAPPDSDAFLQTCRGVDLFRTHDWGTTWDAPVSAHGDVRRFHECADGDARLPIETKYLSLEKLRARFPKTPVEISSSLLPGALSLPFDEGLLRRAKALSEYMPFLEAADVEPNGPWLPYLLEPGSEYEKHAPLLIKLPYAGYRWTAVGRDAGILQPANRKEDATWVVHRMNKERLWTAGRLPDVPNEPCCFDAISVLEDGQLELHIRRLSRADDAQAPGLHVYRSSDGGRSWAKARFESDVLLPVGPQEWFISRLGEDVKVDAALRKAMNEAIAEVKQGGCARHAPPMKTPAIPELAELLKTTNWYMPCSDGPARDWEGGLDALPALHFAVTYKGDSVALLKALLEAGADLNTRTDCTALDHAVRVNAKKAAAFLRKQKTHWGEANEQGRTSLHWLVSTGFPVTSDWAWRGNPGEITRRAVAHAGFLLDHGADVNAKDKDGLSVLHEALAHEAPSELVQLLIKRGATRETE